MLVEDSLGGDPRRKSLLKKAIDRPSEGAEKVRFGRDRFPQWRKIQLYGKENERPGAKAHHICNDLS
jgi:hypothetical protein